MTDQQHTPPKWAALIIGFSLVVWGFVLGALLGYHSANMLYAVAGALLGAILLPIVGILLLMLQRIILWIHLTIFWYWASLLAALSLVYGGAMVVLGAPTMMPVLLLLLSVLAAGAILYVLIGLSRRPRIIYVERPQPNPDSPRSPGYDPAAEARRLVEKRRRQLGAS